MGIIDKINASVAAFNGTRGEHTTIVFDATPERFFDLCYALNGADMLAPVALVSGTIDGMWWVKVNTADSIAAESMIRAHGGTVCH